MSRVKQLIAIVSIFIFASCGVTTSATEESLDAVTIKTDKDSYSSNETVIVTITNGLSEVVEYYGECSLTSCQFANDEWFCAIKDCVAPKQLLPSGSSVQTGESIAGLAGATIRYQFEYFLPSTETLYTVYSNEFFIRP